MSARSKFKNCTSGCTAGGHKSWGECARAKSLRVSNYLSNNDINKRGEAELQAYRDARSQGIEPAGTTMPKIREALDISDRTGVAYDATKSYGG